MQHDSWLCMEGSLPWCQRTLWEWHAVWLWARRRTFPEGTQQKWQWRYRAAKTKIFSLSDRHSCSKSLTQSSSRKWNSLSHWISSDFAAQSKFNLLSKLLHLSGTSSVTECASRQIRLAEDRKSLPHCLPQCCNVRSWVMQATQQNVCLHRAFNV